MAQDNAVCPSAQSKPETERSALAVHTKELTALGGTSVGTVFGREAALDEVIQILRYDEGPNPLVYGDEGIGKSTLAEGLALKIANRDVPDFLQGTRVFAIDLENDVENSFLTLVREIEALEAQERAAASAENRPFRIPALLFIDNFNQGGRIGSALRTALKDRKIRVIAAETAKGAAGFRKQSAFAKHFTFVKLDEPARDVMPDILRQAGRRVGDAHGVFFSDEAYEAALEYALQSRSGDIRLPGSAIRILDRAGAIAECDPSRDCRDPIGRVQIEYAVQATGGGMVVVPRAQIIDRLRTLEHALKSQIFGQDEALATIATSLKTGFADLSTKDRPVASVLLAGPSGTGKTETAKRIASHLGVPLLRYNMSEFKEGHTVSSLIGAPPGYLGYEDGGRLVRDVADSPQCVVLLDELEKADPDIYDLLLQVMDDATLTGHDGQKADFRNVILLMTTNQGTNERQSNAIGFAEPRVEEHRANELESIRGHFPRPFRSRLTRIVSFNELSGTVSNQIVDAAIEMLSERLRQKNVTLHVTKAARSFLAAAGSDRETGARTVENAVREHIGGRLVDELLWGIDGAPLQSVHVDCAADGGLTLCFNDEAELLLQRTKIQEEAAHEGRRAGPSRGRGCTREPAFG